MFTAIIDDKKESTIVSIIYSQVLTGVLNGLLNIIHIKIDRN